MMTRTELSMKESVQKSRYELITTWNGYVWQRRFAFGERRRIPDFQSAYNFASARLYQNQPQTVRFNTFGENILASVKI